MMSQIASGSGRGAVVGRSSAVAPGLRRAAVEALEGRRLMADVSLGGGLVANYYADADFQNLALARVDGAVNFEWGAAGPAAGVPAEGFSVRWTGQVTAPAAGTYTLTADSAGGMRVMVGGTVVVDDAAPHARRSTSGTFAFAAGQYYDLTVEFRDQGEAAARLLWAAGGGPAQVVPQPNLYRLGTGWSTAGWLTAPLGGAAAGTFTSAGGAYALTAAAVPAAGPDGDSGQLAYRTLRGDGEVVARLVGRATGTEADVGLRAGVAPGAPFVDVSLAGGRAWVESRSVQNGPVQQAGWAAAPTGSFVKVRRDGNTFAGYVSPTGADGSWALVGTATAAFDTFAEAGLTVSGGSPTAGATATFDNVRVAVTPQLGANLQKVLTNSPERPFVDLMKLHAGFKLPTDKAAPVGGNGWPTVAEFKTYVATGGAIAAGRYTITFTGASGATVSSLQPRTRVFRASYNAGTREHVWYADCPAGEQYLGFRFKGMTGYGKNIRVLQPGYGRTNTPVYTTRYLDFVKGFAPASLRFMDWTATNELTLSSWTSRTTPTSVNWATKGVAWEAAVELCNAVGANLYVNVPGRADDDYVRQLATLVRTTLRADLNVYVEYGNEHFATKYVNGAWNYAEALAEVKAAAAAGRQSDLNFDNRPVDPLQVDPLLGDGPTWAFRRTARRAVRVADVFRDVWLAAGRPDPLNGRVRVVLAGQIGKLSSYESMLGYLAAVHGPPADRFYAMAGAPYFSMGKYNDKLNPLDGTWSTLSETVTPEELVTAMAASSGSYGRQGHFTRFWSYGKPYGVRLMMYEGGHDTFGPFNVAAKKAATLDPRMRDMMRGYLAAFFAQGGTAFNYYTLGAKTYDSANGTWTITHDFATLDTPKAMAFRDIRTGTGLTNAVPAAGVYG